MHNAPYAQLHIDLMIKESILLEHTTLVFNFKSPLMDLLQIQLKWGLSTTLKGIFLIGLHFATAFKVDQYTFLLLVRPALCFHIVLVKSWRGVLAARYTSFLFSSLVFIHPTELKFSPPKSCIHSREATASSTVNFRCLNRSCLRDVPKPVRVREFIATKKYTLSIFFHSVFFP